MADVQRFKVSSSEQMSLPAPALSALGTEAVAAAERLSATIMVSGRDDRPGIRACARQLDLGYEIV